MSLANLRTGGATKLALRLGSLTFALACASPPAPTPEPLRDPRAPRLTSEPVPEAKEAGVAPPAPTLEPRTLDLPETDPRPPAMRLLETTSFTLLVQDANLRGVLLGLGRESPLNVVVDPDVEGVVTADLADVSMLEILDELVAGRGYRYSVRGNTLRIYRDDRATRTYRVDYPSYKREGETRVALSGFLGSGIELGEGGGGSEGADSSLAQIETTQTTDLWTEIEQAVRTIVFGDPETTAESETESDEGSEAEDGAPSSPTAASLLPSRRVIISRQSGLVTVTAEGDVLDEVDRYLREVAESHRRQVLIDAQIIEVLLSDELDLGFDVEGAPNLGSGMQGVIQRMLVPGLREATLAQSLAPILNEGGFSLGIARNEFGLMLRAIAKQTDVRVVSTPRITTLNNHKAMIKVVRNKVFFVAELETILTEGGATLTNTEFVPHIIPVGVTLDVTPQVSNDDQITLHIRPSVSEVVSVELQPKSGNQSQNGSLPVVDVRETDAVLRVEDGATIVLGGLIQSREFELERKVPLLGSIPLLGQIFRGTKTEEARTELIILLTPTILDPPRIARVTTDMRASFDEVDSIARSRSLRLPWWRRPLFESYGALQ